MTDFVIYTYIPNTACWTAPAVLKSCWSGPKELGQSFMAITDHGVMYGVIDFYKQAKKLGIKPIIGCEVYVAPRTRFDKVYRIDSPLPPGAPL